LLLRLRICALAVLLAAGAGAAAISGRLNDPQGKAGGRATVRLIAAGATQENTTDHAGQFSFTSVIPGSYTLEAQQTGFAELRRPLTVQGDLRLDLHFELASQSQTVNVTADVQDAGILFPHPAERLVIRDETLDANPGRPGAPVSIPGLPIQTASGGIKAPQYFAPGVAGDHGEPIAQYFQIGDYLLPNNLSANAYGTAASGIRAPQYFGPGVAGDHGEPIAQFVQVGSYLIANNLSANARGNGYTDPNICIASVIESVKVDSGAFNVREGNHAFDFGTTCPRCFCSTVRGSALRKEK
jgi:hypothetical protein